mgnify:CR=1 FL=1
MSLRMIKINNQLSVTGLIIKNFLCHLLISSFKYILLQRNVFYKAPEQATNFYPTTNNDIGLRPIKINLTAQQALVFFHQTYTFTNSRSSALLEFAPPGVFFRFIATTVCK